MAVNLLYDAVIHILFCYLIFSLENLTFFELSVGFRIDSDIYKLKVSSKLLIDQNITNLIVFFNFFNRNSKFLPKNSYH